MQLILVILKEVLLHVVGWAVTFLVIIPVTVTFSIFIIFKFIVNWVVLRIHPKWTPLAAQDICCSVFFNPFDTIQAYNNVGFAIVLDAEVNLEDIRQGFSTHLLNLQRSMTPLTFVFDRLRLRPVKQFGNYYWKPVPEERIKLERLIWERSKVMKTDLEPFLSKWLYLNFDPNGTMWEGVVYRDDDEYCGKTVLAFKMSHVLGDGIAVSHMADAIMASLSNFEQPIKNKESFGWKFCLAAPRLLLNQTSAVFLHSDIISRRKKTTEGLLTFATLEVNRIKSLATENGCKFGDIVISLWTNALRRILLETGVEEENLPRSIRVVSPRGIPGRPKPLVNSLTLGILSAKIQNPNRIEKLKKVVHESKFMTKYGLYEVLEKVMGLSYYLPLFFVISTDRAKPGVTCSVSSFPIPSLKFPEKLAFDKYPVAKFYVLQQLFTTNFGFASTFVTTCHGQIDVTIVANKGMVHSQEIMNKFKTYLQEELVALEKSCVNKEIC